MTGPAHISTPGAVELTPIRLVVLVFAPFASGYFLSYYFRTVNAVLAGRLISDLGLDAAQLGLITAAFSRNGPREDERIYPDEAPPMTVRISLLSIWAGEA